MAILLAIGLAGGCASESSNQPPNTAVPSSSADTTTVSTTVPLASSTTLAPGVLSEDLTFAGPFTGHLTTAKVADAGDVVEPRDGTPTGIGACNTTFPVDPAYPNFAVIGIEGELNGKRLLVEVQRDAFTSPQYTKAAGYVRWGDEEYSFVPDLAELDSDLLGATIHSPLATKTPHDWTESEIRGHIRCVPWAAPAAVPDVIVGPPDTQGENGFVTFAQQVRDSLKAGDDSLIFGRFDSLPHTLHA